MLGQLPKGWEILCNSLMCGHMCADMRSRARGSHESDLYLIWIRFEAAYGFRVVAQKTEPDPSLVA
jgi:hypothetical protein